MRTFRFFFLALLLLGIFTFVACEKDPLEAPDLPDTPVVDATEQIQGLVMADSAACYEITFPITFLFEDGSTEVAGDESELDSVLLQDPGPINVQYPINLVDVETGATVSAADEEALIALLILCDFDIPAGPTFYLPAGACWEVAFPVDLQLADGGTITVSDETAFFNAISSNNPPVDFAYPVLVAFSDPNTSDVEVNDEDGFFALDDLCDDIVLPTFGVVDILNQYTLHNDSSFTCFNYVYPISINTFDADSALVTIVINTDADWANYADQIPFSSFVYPIQVVTEDGGETLTLTTDDEVTDAISDCHGPTTSVLEALIIVSVEIDTMGFVPCYTFDYPIGVNLVNGEEIEVTEDNAWFPILDAGIPFESYDYPFTVTENSTGATLTVNDGEEVAELVEDCL